MVVPRNSRIHRINIHSPEPECLHFQILFPSNLSLVTQTRGRTDRPPSPQSRQTDPGWSAGLSCNQCVARPCAGHAGRPATFRLVHLWICPTANGNLTLSFPIQLASHDHDSQVYNFISCPMHPNEDKIHLWAADGNTIY